MGTGGKKAALKEEGSAGEKDGQTADFGDMIREEDWR